MHRRTPEYSLLVPASFPCWLRGTLSTACSEAWLVMQRMAWSLRVLVHRRQREAA